MNEELTIDPELQSLLPPLDDSEKKQLRDNLIADGCREPIYVWANHDDVVIDGHNRYEICLEDGIPYKTVALSFPSKAAVMQWMYQAQIGRRNLTQERKTYILGKLYEAEKREVGGQSVADWDISPHSTPERTSEKLAKANGVNERTVRRAEKFAKSVDTVAESAPDLKDAILSRKVQASQKDVATLAASEPEVVKAVARQVADGEKSLAAVVAKPPKSAIKGIAEITATLGKLSRQVDALHDRHPNKTQHDRMLNGFRLMNTILSEWEDV